MMITVIVNIVYWYLNYYKGWLFQSNGDYVDTLFELTCEINIRWIVSKK